MPATGYPRRFVPTECDPADFAQIETLYSDLKARPLPDAAALEQWLLDFSELESVIDEYGSRRYVDKSCHTEDAEIKKRFLHFIEEIEPRVKPLSFELKKRYLESPHRAQLNSARYRILSRNWAADVDRYREKNIPIETEVARLVTDYDQINGRMTVQFRGKELTMQQAAQYLEDPDRATRQEAWELSQARRLADREAIEMLYDTLLPLRQQIAVNADLPDFRAFQWKANKRFDYTPGDCLRFADAVAETCMPLVHELNRQRAVDLKLPTLRPWDASVDPQSRPRLRPFEQNDITGFVNKTRAIFQRLSPALASDFDQLSAHGNLDLESRKGKQPGGYLMPLEESRQPFIFMNAAGLHRDVETLLHEGGHAFHHLAAAGEELVFLRSAPMEFCEVASMSMELLADAHLDVFYNPQDAARAKRKHLEGIIGLLPWIATIDSFQHWIYTHPGHSRDERKTQWLAIHERFGPKLDWSGYEQTLGSLWQRQGHLFHAPFYYIEYGIAQLGALQLWTKSLHDPHAALNNYRAALALGGTKTLPELFSAAGIVFDFSSKTIKPLMDAIGEELSQLPR